MLAVTDTLAFYANSPETNGDDFLAVFRWLLIDRETQLTDDQQLVAELIAGDQDELTANRAAKTARFRNFLKQRREMKARTK